MAAEILTAKEAAEFLRVSPNTVKSKARAGELPAAKIGREWRFRKADLDEWLRRGGDNYEEIVDQGLVSVMLEREDEPTVPWEQVRAALGL